MLLMNVLGDPVLSVIIPTKNEEKQITECLDSIRNQNTSVPYEVIIVDSSATRHTFEIGEIYGAIVIQEPRHGKGIAVNTGAKHARGNILCFTEADCRVPPNWLDTIYEEFQHHPEAVAIVGDYVYHDSTWYYNLLAKIALPISIWGFYLFKRNHSLRGTNFAIRTTAYHQAGGFSPSARELQDVELGLRVSKFGNIRYVPSLKITTSARRVHGRIFQFIREFFPAIYRLFILKQVPEEPTYEDIRY